MPSAKCRLPIDHLPDRPIGNRKLTLGNDTTHPLPRGGTDFTPLEIAISVRGEKVECAINSKVVASYPGTPQHAWVVG